MLVRYGTYLLIVFLLIAASACAPSTSELVRQLEDRDPGQRIRAIIQTVGSERTELLPNLVDRLEDDDSAVRFYAIVALEKLVGTRLGYSYAARTSQRAEAIRAWRDLLSARDGIGLDADVAGR